jgi:hypothetical protein
MYAPMMVKITSTTAMSNTRYECAPSPTFPKISLYLQGIYNLYRESKLTWVSPKYLCVSLQISLILVFVFLTCNDDTYYHE